MKKILFVAKVDSHIAHFHSKYFTEISKKGYDIDVMSEGDIFFENTRKKYNINFGNNPFSKINISNFRKILSILKEEQYDIIQCNTAVASVIIRLAKGVGKIESSIVYMAHGFHFYKKGPIRDWILYYPIEKILGRYTDKLVLINKEDYHLAMKYHIGRKQVLIPGVGVDIRRFNEIPLKSKGLLNKDCIYFTYIAEINANKNHKLLIDSMLLLKKQGIEFICNFIGDGTLIDEQKLLVKELGLEKNVFFVGYKTNIEKYLKQTDIYLSSSIREGFGLNLVEALASGVPIICTKNRGHSEILIEGYNGFYAQNPHEFVQRINDLIVDEELYLRLVGNCKKSIEKFTIEHVKHYYIDSVVG